MATRMQQRRGTAAQWISTNNGNGPILAPGELGFEIDTNKFKIGDGVNHWVNLTYFTDAASALASITGLVDGAPDLLNTLNELAAAIGDDPAFFTTIGTDLSNHTSATTNVHGILDTDELATKEYVTTEIGNSEVDQAALAGTGLTWDANAQQFTVNTTLIQERVTGVSDEEIGYLSGVTSDIQTQLNAKLASADLDEAAQEAVNTALVAGTGLDKTYDDLNNTITIDIDSTVATKTYVDDQIAAFDALPTQTGNDGKFLQTTGSGTQWAEVDLTTKQDSLTVGDGLDLTGSTLSVNPAEMVNKVVEGVSGQSYGLVGTSQYLDTKTGNGYNAEIELDILAVEAQLDTDGYAKQTDISTAITNLNLASTYDAYGSASTAETNANNYTDTSISGLSGNVTAVVAGNLDVLTGTGITTGAGSIEVDFTELSTRYDALGAADAAELDANNYTDDAITALNLATTYDAYGAASTVAGNLTTHESDTSTHGVTSSIVGTDDSQTLTNKTISSANNTITVQVANVSDLTATATELNTLDGITASTAELNYVDGVTSAIQTQLNAKAPLASPTFTGTATTNDLVVDGDFTVNGTNFAASATSITIEDNMVQLAHQNAANTVDLGIVVGYNDGAAKHSGIVRDVSADKWKLFKGVTTEPTTTVDFTQGSLDTLAVATLEGNVTGNVTGDVTGNADTATALETARNIAGQSFDGTADISIAPTDLTGVTATAAEINILDGATLSTTELNYVDGVTSSIQDQIDAKLASSTAASTYAPINSPTFTGTVSGVSKSMVGLGSVDNTADADKPVSSATQTALNLKADLNAPTFSGTVSLPSTTTIGDVSATELGYLDGVTSSIQTQIDGKQSTLPYQGQASGKFLTSDGQTVSWGTVRQVPAYGQASGKFLTSDGNTTYWGTVDALPYQGQASGKFLTSDGSTASWSSINQVPASSTTQSSTISSYASAPAQIEMYADGAMGRLYVLNNAGWDVTSVQTALEPFTAGTALTIVAGGSLGDQTSVYTIISDAYFSFTEGPYTTGAIVIPIGTGPDSGYDYSVHGMTSAYVVSGSLVFSRTISNAGKYLTNDGTNVSWDTLPITAGTATITSTQATAIDSIDGSSVVAAEYTIRLKQYNKIRTSKVILNGYVDQLSGGMGDISEFAIVETNGSITGVNISYQATMMGIFLMVTATDAGQAPTGTPVEVKFTKVAL